MVYQPPVRSCHRRMAGMEALLRWQHPELGGAVSPGGDFVPVAEQRGHIHELTEQLIRCIRRDLEACAVDHGRGRRLAINISARQIADGRLDGLLEPSSNGFDRLAGSRKSRLLKPT